MASLFAARRKSKRVGRESDAASPADEEDSGPVVRRPGLANVPKNKSKLRLSFGPGQSGSADDDLPDNKARDFVASKKGSAVEHVAGNNLVKRSLGPLKPVDQGATRAIQDDDRPTYSKDYLDELRNSTPSTPRDLPSYTSEDGDSYKELDLLSKFGVEEDTAKSIPSHVEIQEKKERRARLAKEQDFIPLEDESNGRYLQLSTHKEVKETRLVRDDEDLAEGFDQYVEDPGRVALGKKAKAVQRRQQREAMRGMIDDAENVSDEDESETERNLAYESAQTRKAMDGIGSAEEQQGDTVNHGPPIITPIPRLSSILERLRSKISTLEYTRAKCSERLADLQQEKAEVAVREIEIQRLVRDAGEKYENLRQESKTHSMGREARESEPKIERGLETMGAT